jgi:hypothetical protein
VKKGHASELVHIYLLKIQKVSNILGNTGSLYQPVDLGTKSSMNYVQNEILLTIS